MKKLSIALTFLVAIMVWQEQAQAIPIPCIICGSTPIAGPGVDGTVSYAVIPGAVFNAELAAHAIGFLGLVPPGTLGPIIPPAASDFVYLYQMVNTSIPGVPPTPITQWDINVSKGLVATGGRLESTLFVDPTTPGGPSLVTVGPVAAPTVPGLAGGSVDFENGLGDPIPGPVFPPWGPCLGSGGIGVNCSDGQADLFANFIKVWNWQETPSGVNIDPSWTSSIIWFSSAVGPSIGTTTIHSGGLTATGNIPIPIAIPEPATLALMGLGLTGLGFSRRRKL